MGTRRCFYGEILERHSAGGRGFFDFLVRSMQYALIDRVSPRTRPFRLFWVCNTIH